MTFFDQPAKKKYMSILPLGGGRVVAVGTVGAPVVRVGASVKGLGVGDVVYGGAWVPICSISLDGLQPRTSNLKNILTSGKIYWFNFLK